MYNQPYARENASSASANQILFIHTHVHYRDRAISASSQGRRQWYGRYGHGREKMASLELQSMRAYSPPAFVTASGRPKYDHAFSGPFRDFFEASSIQTCDEDWSMLTPFGRETSPRNMGGANVREIQCCACLRMMASVKKRGQIKPFSQPTSHFSVESLEKLLM